uniref:Uncharacterized protein n=1 Tax=Glossina palpalis gambiensis TaxID=67801 RepID=A0A1B0AMV7_9MUSC
MHKFNSQYVLNMLETQERTHHLNYDLNIQILGRLPSEISNCQILLAFKSKTNKISMVTWRQFHITTHMSTQSIYTNMQILRIHNSIVKGNFRAYKRRIYTAYFMLWDMIVNKKR